MVLAAALIVLVLAAFNPVSGTRLYIYVDYNPNVGGDSRPALARNLISQRDGWLRSGHSENDIHYLPGDSSNVREVVARLANATDTAALPVMDQLLEQFKDGLGAAFSTPDFGRTALNNLASSVEEIEASGRAGDQLVVLSTWRGAPQNWALDWHRFGSIWIQVAGESSGSRSSPISVQSYEIAHYPGLQPVLSILIRAKAGIELLNPPPSLFLTDDGVKKCADQTGVKIAVNANGAPSAIGTLTTGSLGRDLDKLVQIRIILPTSGPRYVCVGFPAAMDILTQLQQPLFVGVRQLQLSASPGLALILKVLVGRDFEPSDGELSISPLVAAKSAKSDGSEIVSILEDRLGGSVETGNFDIKVLPALDPSSARALWDLSIEAKTAPSIRLDAVNYTAESKARLSGHHGIYQAAPNCGEEGSIVTATRQGEIGNCHEILRMNGSRLELYLPPLKDIISLQDPQRRALRTILVLAGAIVSSNSNGLRQLPNGSRQLPITREDFAVTSAATEATGWSAIEETVWKQLLDALRGKAKPRSASNAANSIRPTLLSLALLLIAIVAGIGLARPLMLSFSRTKESTT